MRAIRAGLDRHLNKEEINFSIITDREFKVATDAFNTHLLKLSCKQGKILSYFIYVIGIKLLFSSITYMLLSKGELFLLYYIYISFFLYTL